MQKRDNSYLLALTYGLISCTSFLFAPAARADEIAVVEDTHGHKVYINTGEPTTSPVAWTTRGFRTARAKNSPLPAAHIDRLVKETANRLDVDPELVHAIIRVESEYNPNAVSRKGAMGLMQLIPSTAQRFGVGNPFDPKQNIEGGISYLKFLLDLFRGDLPLSLAAYNAGENSVLRAGGVPSFAETRDYVRKVTELYNGGSVPGATPQDKKPPYRAPIYRYVDEQGVVHYTNVD